MDEEIEQIGKQFRELRVAFREQGGMQHMLEEAQSNCKSTGDSFQNCWKPLGNKFKKLRQSCGGVASVMPGTSSVESDFSIINWTKDSHSKCLTDFSLEAILHCKQYGMLQKLVGQQ
jgi:hypothetical protein